MDSSVTDLYMYTIFHWNVWGKLYCYKPRNSWMYFDEAIKKVGGKVVSEGSFIKKGFCLR